MSSIIKVDTIQDQAGNNIINESSDTITIGASGDTVNIVGTLQNNGSALTGDISSVVAGTGLSGGGTSGDVTLNVEAAQSGITSLGTLTALNVAGNATITVSDNSDTLTLVSTDADANSGPKLNYYRNSSSPADSDYIGTTTYVGRNDNSENVNYVAINAQANDVSDGNENATYIINRMRDGALDQVFNIGPNSVVFNEDSKDVDFRVETDAQTHGIFMEGSSGNTFIGTSSGSIGNVGVKMFGTDAATNKSGVNIVTAGGNTPCSLNRSTGDGDLMSFRSETTQEGTISVSGTTVSYNGFTGTHWSRFTDNSTPSILRGTVLETLDEMCDWYNLEFDVTEDGQTWKEKIPHVLADGEAVGDIVTYNYKGTDYQATIVKEDDIKHMKSKVSDTIDAKNVYGVFNCWEQGDEGYNDFLVASVGSFVVRIKSGQTIAKGDLLQSNGDGTAKVQSDDNVKSSSFAKVLSTTIIETYDDGSFIVPCSLMC